MYAKGRKDGVTCTVLHWSKTRQEVSHKQWRRLLLLLLLLLLVLVVVVVVAHYLHCTQ
jgi:hypothetical protein